MLNMRKALAALTAVGITLGLASIASADTLQLKNGMVVQGRYVGGTGETLQFEVGPKVQLYPVSDLLSVTFTGAPGTASVAENIQSDSGPVSNAPISVLNTTSPPSTSQTSAPANTASSVTVPAGTQIMVRMIDSVDSKTNHVGDRFRASLEADLVANGVVVAPKGADVYGRLADAQQAGHLTGKAQLKLELTDILIQNRMQPIMTGEYDLAGKSRGRNTAKKAGGGAAVGAIIGAIAGGGKGAAIGAGVGAGAGTAVNVATQGEQVNVPSETLLEFRLQQPFTLQLN